MGVKFKLGVSSVVAAAVAIAVPNIKNHEGYAARVYVDPVGIKTYCYGETANPEVGRVYSKEYCEYLLSGRAGQFIQGVRDSVPASVYMTPSELAAWGSFSYNVGLAAFKSSTAHKLLVQGKHTQACKELPKWVYAKRRKLPGLVTRRQVEMELCLRDYIKEK